MNSPDAWMEALQRQREPVLPDDGFSQRVVDGLPNQLLRAGMGRRLTMGAAAIIGGTLTVALAPPIERVLDPLRLDAKFAPMLSLILVAALSACAAWAFISLDFRGCRDE